MSSCFVKQLGRIGTAGSQAEELASSVISVPLSVLCCSDIADLRPDRPVPRRVVVSRAR